MEGFKKYILEQVSKKELPLDRAMELLQELEEACNSNNSDNRIAVIGMACKLSEAENYEEFWENLFAGRDCLNYMPEDFIDYYQITSNPVYAEVLGIKPVDIRANRFIGRSSYIKDSDKFDAAFFNIPPREAKYINPSQRIFLQTAWSAIEDAGYGLNEVQGGNIGVFVGKDHNNAEFYKNITKPDTLSTTGSWHSILASRISYLFNFRGPAVVMDTACSSGLVSVHEACRALQGGDCEMAIAGGIAVGGSPSDGTEDEDEAPDALNAVASADTTVRPFDKKSSGTVFGEGAVAFVLKSLDKAIRDGDHIHAVIVSSTANNDGASNGITAPNPAAQEDVICKAWEDAGIDPKSISYVEAHGTGTLLGDPIEYKALNNAFRRYTQEKQFCGIGSVKGNVGHLIAASGCAGMLKVILSMQNKSLPASIHFEEPNPHINYIDSALYIVDQNTPWGRNGEVLRAGVSSFGFSGTNAHVILESADKYIKKSEGSKTRPRLLLLSAKTEWSLQQLVDRYSEYLERHKDIDLDSLCYTAGVGRGHYNYRIAVPFTDYDSLKKIIDRLCYQNLNIGTGNDAYYGYYKIVSDKREERSEGEYTESEVRMTNQKANEIISHVGSAENLTIEDCREIASCYIHGANLNWNMLYTYTNNKPQRINLPTYPFEPTKYWADPKVLTASNENALGEPNDHPFVERCLVRSIDHDIYTTKFSIKKHWILHDHVIMGNNIIPGTAYIETAREACSKYIDGNMEIRDLVFYTPLAARENEEIETQIIVNKHKNYVSFVIATQKNSIDSGGDEWIKHAEGKAYKLDEAPPQKVDLSRLETDTSLIKSPVELATLDQKDVAMCFGPRWQNVKYVYVSPKELYVHAKLPDEFSDDLNKLQYHTSMLDATINAGIQAVMNDVYLPFVFKSIKLYKRLPQEMFSCAIGKDRYDGENKETYTFDVQLTDTEGNVLVDISDYTIKKVHKFNVYPQKEYYKVEWIPNARENVNRESLGNVLVFGYSMLGSELAGKLADASETVIKVEPGTAFADVGYNSYTVGCSEESYRELFAAVKEKCDIQTIIYANSYGPVYNHCELYEQPFLLENGIYGLFYANKAIIHEKIHGQIDIIVLTDHAKKVTGNEKTIKPENAALIGLSKCIVQEYPNLMTREIDTDENTSVDELFSEIMNADYKNAFVALRDSKRYVECLTKVERESQEKEYPINVSEGCVLITGGTGGLGLETAKYMAEKGCANICLLARTKFPDKELWGDILDANEDAKICRVINSVREIGKSGTNVFIVSADIADEASIRNTVNDIVDKFGKITGVVHCAGVAGDGFIVNKPFDVFRNVISPKIIGTKVLDTVLNWDDIDFFVAYSSMTTLLGGPGQSDYTAANSYLDAYAQLGSIQGKNIITVNWPAWSETGMAVDYQVADEHTIFSSLNNQAAISALDDVLTHRISNAVLGELNYPVIAMVADELPMQLSDPIRKAIDVQKKRNQDNGGSKSRNFNAQDVLIIGKSDYTEVERKVAYIYAGVLDLTEIDIYENFNSLGGNSMVSTEILKVLNQYFDDMLDVSDIFSYPTVVEMAEYIESKINNDADKKNYDENNVGDMLNKLEAGEIEIDKMISYFED